MQIFPIGILPLCVGISSLYWGTLKNFENFPYRDVPPVCEDFSPVLGDFEKFEKIPYCIGISLCVCPALETLKIF